MHQDCVVCQHLHPQANLRDRPLHQLSFGGHTVTLCEGHRRIAHRSGVTTFEQLRELYGESEGRRSFVPDVDGQKQGRRATD